VDEAALGKNIKKVGFIGAHGLQLVARPGRFPRAGGVTGPASDSTSA
jgi:hypothetical protein